MAFRMLNPKGVWPEGMSLVRIITGVLLIVHGTQMLQTDDMSGYGEWLAELNVPFPLFTAYAGKFIELAGGLSFVLGFLTRVTSAILFFSFLFITLVMGSGKILTDAQHPFLFALLSLVVFFAGSGKWSLDNYVKN